MMEIGRISVKMFLHIAAFWGAVLVGAWIYVSSDVPQPSGVLAPGEPLQTVTTERSWTRDGADFTAMAEFNVHARVLSTNHYSFDRQAGISPVDLALGWGRMSDSDILSDVIISQSGRFYSWRPKLGHSMPLSKKELLSHSANMHMIPATDDVKKTLLEVRTGEIVDFSGYLVEVVAPNEWKWRSSMSRTDMGISSCEVVWVEHITVTGTVITSDGQ
jgi:hypothetical protein